MQAMLYQPMVSSNIVRLEGAIDFYSVMHCISQLTVASFSCRAITLVLSTGGGFVVAALALYRHMETMKQMGFHITVICPDMVASAGTLILQAASLRILREGTSFGMHKPFALCPHEQLYHQYGVSDIPCNDVCRYYNKMSVAESWSVMLAIYERYSRLSRQELDTRCTSDMLWLTPYEAIQYGFADAIL